jgi:hypothetical protein
MDDEQIHELAAERRQPGLHLRRHDVEHGEGSAFWTAPNYLVISRPMAELASDQ